MKIQVSRSAMVAALLGTAALAVTMMVLVTQLDAIVHGVLRDEFGLLFSYRWAMPYWVNSALIIGLSWFNLLASAGLVYYFVRRQASDRVTVPTVTRGTARAVLVAPYAVPRQTLEPFLTVPVTPYDVTHPDSVIDSQC